MFRNISVNRKIWISVGVLSLISSVIGVLEPSIYDKVVSSDIMPGVFGQDLMTVPVSILVIGLALRIKERNYIKQILVLGLVGFFFYAYGIYVIEQIYTPLYYIYLAIFGLSSYSIVYSLVSFRGNIVEKIKIPKAIRGSSAAYSLLIAGIFTALWIGSLYPQISSGERLDYLYSIYILDLCFIMPAFAIGAIKALKKRKSGLLFLPALFVLGSPLIGSLALAEGLKPLKYGMGMDVGLFGINMVVSGIFTVLAVLYLWKLKVRYSSS